MHPYSFGMILGGIVAGVLCGLGPLFAGRRRRHRPWRIAGFVVCVACGFARGFLLAAPVAIVWTVVLLSLRGKPGGYGGYGS